MFKDTATKEDMCFWCGMKPGTPTKPGKIALCPDCLAELAPKEEPPSLEAEAFEPN